MKKIKCSNCGSDARSTRGDYQFTESGLPDLLLPDIELLKCSRCANVDPVLNGVEEIMHLAALAVLRKPYRLDGAELRFLRKHVDLTQEAFAKLLGVDKTTLSKWENNDDPIGFQSDLWARAVVMSRDKHLEKHAADHIRELAKVVNKQKRVTFEVNTATHDYEYA